MVYAFILEITNCSSNVEKCEVWSRTIDFKNGKSEFSSTEILYSSYSDEQTVQKNHDTLETTLNRHETDKSTRKIT